LNPVTEKVTAFAKQKNTTTFSTQSLKFCPRRTA